MKSRAKKLLSLLILTSVSLLTACGGQRQIKLILPCPKPQAPVLQALNPKRHIASPRNLELLLNNLADLRTYAESLETTVNCYEEQR